MTFQNKHSFTNESRLARWFGEDVLSNLKYTAAGLTTPTPIMYTPDGDAIYAVDGMFLGAMRGGAFTSLTDLILEAEIKGRRQDIFFNKAGTTGAVGFANSLWRVGNQPAAAAAAAALAGGTHNNNTTVGGFDQRDPVNGMHLTNITANAAVIGQVLLMYDRLWNGLIALSSSATQTCTLTGYPNSTGRYSGTSAGANNSVGNFAFIANENGATLSAVAHVWTLTYTDHAGNTAQAAPNINGISGAIVNRVDHADWFIPLLAGDYGISDIESIKLDVATVAAGAPTIVLAHPLALIPFGTATVPVFLDGINSAFNLVEVKTDACIALMEPRKTATGAGTYNGTAVIVEAA